MARSLLRSFVPFLGATLILASPISLLPRQGTFSTLATADIDRFHPLTFFASAAYCPAAQTKDWSCGGALYD